MQKKLESMYFQAQKPLKCHYHLGTQGSKKGWLAIAKLKPLSFSISLLSMLKKAFGNVKIQKKRKVKVVLA